MNIDQESKIAALLFSRHPLFKALGDEARLDIITLLATHDKLSVGELASRTALSRPAISHHLKILKDAGLLTETKTGVKRYYKPSFTSALQSLNVFVDEARKTHELL